jgi:hypothetical protein
MTREFHLAPADDFYQSGHVGPLRESRQWFSAYDGPCLVLWWLPAGRLPTVAMAVENPELLRSEGPSPEAFTFRRPFPAPGQAQATPPEVDAESCGGAARSGIP